MGAVAADAKDTYYLSGLLDVVSCWLLVGVRGERSKVKSEKGTMSNEQ